MAREQLEMILNSLENGKRQLYFNFFSTLSKKAWDFAAEVIIQQEKNFCEQNPQDPSCEV